MYIFYDKKVLKHFNIHFKNFFCRLFSYIQKCLKDISVKYYQKNKEKTQKLSCQRNQNVTEKEKKKSENLL